MWGRRPARGKRPRRPRHIEAQSQLSPLLRHEAGRSRSVEPHRRTTRNGQVGHEVSRICTGHTKARRETDDGDTEAGGPFLESVSGRPRSRPRLVGVFLIMGKGLGASGPAARLGFFVLGTATPGHVQANPYLAHYFDGIAPSCTTPLCLS